MLQRLRAIVRSTPGRLTAAIAVLLVLGIAYGITAFTGSINATNDVSSIRHTSGPLTVEAQSLYRALSDADATASAEFLSAGDQSDQLRSRYLADIAGASTSLAAVTAGSERPTAAMNTLATELPVYGGLVEAARANNRLGYPVGAAYLREASGLMRQTLLPAANTVYQQEAATLARDHRSASGYPYFATLFGLVLLAALVGAQRYVTRRTRRRFNVGLVAASAVMVAAIIYQNISWASLHSHLDAAAARGSDQVNTLVQARIAALRARADESLTLIAHGSGGAFETDFKNTMKSLVGTDGSSGALGKAERNASDRPVRDAISRAMSDLRAWQEVHTALRDNDDSGRFTIAVGLAVGPASVDASQVADHDLGGGIDAANDVFATQAADASDAIRVVGIVVLILTLLALGGLTVGVQRRIAEYR
ncbi:MAG TPA: hypothetical protein VH442_06645 [Micromonosporaceae bacterium]